MRTARKHTRTRAQESSGAIERMYISMRHLFNRGFYKPMGISGETLRESLLTLSPEIYGSINEEKTELQGLLYVIDRLPYGIEECRFINLTSDEGYKDSHFKPIVPAKRRRNCFRIDREQMNIEITRGRSDIYDILTHLTFLYIESHKIMKQVLINEKGDVIRDWKKLEEAVCSKKELSQKEKEVALTHTANFLGRTFEEVKEIYPLFECPQINNRFLNIIYYLGKMALDEELNNNKRLISFSPVLRERLGHHIHGEEWARNIKSVMHRHGLLGRPLHIISANMHSVLNSLFAPKALKNDIKDNGGLELFIKLSDPGNARLQQRVKALALKEGMHFIADTSGANINVQLFDTSRFYEFESPVPTDESPVILVMDYAFGEQAYETMDELLKPYEAEAGRKFLDVRSISIMGKAGILEGKKGDIMIPSAHVFEGTADNYPFKNRLKKADFQDLDLDVFTGSMITVLGTSLQNRDILRFFHRSTWKVVGLEMEGAHYQKAIQSASRIRGSISPKVVLRYAYYASDNPLESGSTLASGGLGQAGVKPTYAITQRILNQILA